MARIGGLSRDSCADERLTRMSPLGVRDVARKHLRYAAVPAPKRPYTGRLRKASGAGGL